jgi:hypothetical protein
MCYKEFLNRKKSEKAPVAPENLPGLRTAFPLAKKMGRILGTRQILQPVLPQPP